ncbi:GDP-mannose 4,6-dehydratase [Algibacter luteus]|uniref:GDP-mannose 4,6-dehydratase n=1 Tax=Algibacter luteus TaxID=1178825 RepID=A0A1M6D9Y1_9FLAO|nr:GDP-mannose 4,6-dehydratase [Algibacter luteus]SHI70036.1 GDPmannose 4,6-dehydratase [Algibacter luteus]
MKKAIITGITGQDAAYLAELLLEKGYKVYGTYRRTSSTNFWRIEELGVDKNPNLTLLEYDLIDLSSAYRIISEIEPDEIYNLAAQSFVGVSFTQPIATAQITGVGAMNLLEAIRTINPKIKFYQASTSEMFGKVHAIPQNEETPFHPRSPYGVAKVFAHWATLNYQESYNLFATSGILFNHESPLRGKEFVTRKITDAVAKIHLGKQSLLELGNMDAKRDWGFAKEYVVGMYQMLQIDEPGTFVLATNQTQTVRDFVSLAFQAIDIDISWKGKEENEIGFDDKTGKELIKVNPKFYRPAEVDLLIGDASKANEKLNWKPKTTLKELCDMMVKKDIERNQNGGTF